MNTRNSLLLATLVSAFALVSPDTYASGIAGSVQKESFELAANSGYSSAASKSLDATKSNIANNLDQIRMNWNSFHTDNGFLAPFARKGLSAADKKSFADAVKQFHRNSMLAYKTKIQELKDRYRTSSPDISVVKKELSSLIDNRMSVLRDSVAKYIDPNKKAAFEKFIKDRAAKMKANAAIRIGNTQAKNQLRKP